MSFNLLDHPIYLSEPQRTSPSAWTEHVPFGMLLIDLVRPKVFVELGTHAGMSYCAFCQAVSELKLDTRCYAVDTWQGDEQAGFYRSDILADLQSHHDSRYSSFSTLIQSTFDDAIGAFADHSIDLLHIDGFHTYEAVKHDTETWLPKMSDRGVIVFHDIAEHMDDFGVWKFWDELKQIYPNHLELYHEHGLGVLAVGEVIPEGLLGLMRLPDEQWRSMRSLMFEQGVAVKEHIEVIYLRQQEQQWRQERENYEARLRREHEEQEALAWRLKQTQNEANAALEAEKRRAAEERAIQTNGFESALEASEWRITETQTRLNNALWQLKWLESSRGVRMVKLARASRALLRKRGPLALSKRVFLWSIGKRGYYLRDLVVNVPVPQIKKQQREYKQALFLSGCPGDAMRYRCEHQVEQLRLMGCSSEFATYGTVDLGDLLDRFQCFFLHRVPYGEDIEWFISEAKQRGKPVIFETDDLVFDPDAVKHIAALEDMTQAEKDLYLDGVRRYRTTLLSCAAATVSTETLRERVKPLRETVYVTPNVVSKEMVRRADMALSIAHTQKENERDSVTIAYFSGSPTHNRDFAVAQEAVLWILEKYPRTRFKLVGHLRLDPRFDRYGARVERVPLQPWQSLPELYRSVQINLAPLEPDNVFTDSKSSIKYLEAALVRVPTVASPRMDFVRVVEHGVTGLLAETDEEWREALGSLVESTELRQRLGENAYNTVRKHNTTISQASYEYDTLRTIYRLLKAPQERRKLRINWIIRAPIAERGGGYRTIFRLANSLGSKGHTVRVYVEPIAHLQDMTDSQIQAFVAKNFGPLHVQIFVGHDNILPADATIATNWPTAYTVAEHHESLFKFYFVQDFEPEFYEPDERSYHDAERTYTLPLQHICIGSHLSNRIAQVSGVASQTLDFAIDSEAFTVTRPQAERSGATSVLFFARPGLKRRGYELGIEALRLAKEQQPDLNLFLFGSTDDELGKLPFEATNLGVLSPEQLADAMNSIHILLTFSLSNISWVPFEGMACGMAVVEADVPSVREMVLADETCLLATPEPHAVAKAVLRLTGDLELRTKLATNAAEAMKQRTWTHTIDQFEQILLDQCW